VHPVRLTRRELLAYAAYAVPLAMAALPVYVHVPKFYADELGLPLATVGAILLACRLLDAFQDPLLGYLSDRTSDTRPGRGLLVLLSLPLLAGGFLGLFHPPAASASGVAAWLALCLVVVYLGFSLGSISYYAMGAELSRDYHERTRITATRGALAVLGVLIAAAAPQALSSHLGPSAGLALFSVMFVPVLLVAAGVTLRHAHARRAAPRPAAQTDRAAATLYQALIAPLRSAGYRWLIAVSILSGIAAAIPGTLILFYVQDVLQRPELSGAFLALYFLFGAAGMPLWIGAAQRMGKKRAWLIGMFLSVAAFAWAYPLGPGDVWAFAAVCVLSGIAYGAELALPPSILADIVDRSDAQRRPDGAYFGMWQMVDKLNLALAAGLALPLLQGLGYVPGAAQPEQAPLSLMYALLPCLIKLAAIACLWIAPLEARGRVPLTSSGATMS
jgi:glycoside/pentoside/hexuronide:cation symporter, GPH family